MNLNDFVYKTNSPELEAYFEQFGKQFYIDADEINSIVETLKLMSNNVASSGFIEKNAHGFTGQNYIIAPFFKWAIDNNLYSNLDQVTLIVPYAALGKTRFERIAANTDNTFVRIVGAESSSAAALPDLPTDTIELSRYLVRDNSIDAPLPVEPAGYFVEKATYSPLILPSVGVIGSLEMDKRAAIKATGALTELGNIIKNNSTHHFPGQLFVFIDATPDGGVKLPQLYTGGGSGNIAWFHPDGLDYFTQKNEVVLFVEDTIGAQKVNRRISSGFVLKNKSVTLEKLQDINSQSVFGRISPGIGQPQVLDVFDLLVMLDLQDVVYDLSLKAPKENPVFTGSVIVPNATLGSEAVNLNQLNSIKNKRLSNTSLFTHTGTTLYTKVAEIIIPANTIADNEIWEVDLCASRNGTNFSNDATIACVLEPLELGSSDGFLRNMKIGSTMNARMRTTRTLFFSGGNVRRFSNSGSFTTDYAVWQFNKIDAFDKTIENKISVYLTLANSADTANFEYLTFRKIN